MAHNPGLHGIWIYDSDVPTFKLTQTPLFEAESNLGIKKDGQGFYALSGAAPQSALTPFIQQIKASGSTFVYDDVTTSEHGAASAARPSCRGSTRSRSGMCNSGCYDPNFYKQGGATVNGTYASLIQLPYLTDYKANPALDKLVTDLGGLDNVNNNAINSYIMGFLFQDVVNKAIANGGTLDRASLFTALKRRALVQRGGHDRRDRHRRPRWVRLLGARAAAERGVAAGGPDTAGHLRLQPGQRRDAQDERLVAVPAQQ